MKKRSELRARIVAALNLTPLVPPQADTETLNVVDDAWVALSELMRSVEQLRNAEDRANASDRVREKWEAKHAGLLEQKEACQAWLDALNRAATYYRQALKEIIENCGHDKPDTEKIISHAQTGILAADHELKVVEGSYPANSSRCYCGDLTWTERHHGRVTHKHACPARMDDWCQTHPEGGCDPVAARAALEAHVPAKRPT